MQEELLALEEASLGREEYTTRIAELEQGAQIEAESIIRFLRGIPATDTRKKNELAAFFQSPAGSRYTREERHALYNDLLGKASNQEHIG